MGDLFSGEGIGEEVGRETRPTATGTVTLPGKLLMIAPEIGRFFFAGFPAAARYHGLVE